MDMRKLIYVFFSIALLSGCKNNHDEYSLYHEDGRAKPIVIVAPVIDSTSYDIPWSLSEEFTDLVVSKLSQKGLLFLPTDEKHHNHVSKNPFGSDLAWIKNHYSNTEFVVFLEIVEHEEVPVTKKNREITDVKTCSKDLNVALRIRAIDLRGTTPKVVLQQLVKDSYYISKNLLHTDYDVTVWGTEEYASSPMGLAHGKFIKEIAHRVCDYILLAKSR